MFSFGISVVVFLFAIALFLTIKSPGRLQNLSLAATSVLAILLIAEIAITVIGPRFESHLVVTTTSLDNPTANLNGRRPILGWGPSAPGRYRTKHVLNGKLLYDTVYTIDHDLLRKVDSGKVGKGIAFLGDSFVFGEGVQDSDTLPQLFANLEGRTTPVYNLGFKGYSPAQALAEMRAGIYDKQLKNSRLFVEFVAPWQSERVSCKATFVVDAPRFVQVNDRIIPQGKCVRAPEQPLANFALYRLVQPMLPVVRDSDIDIFTAVTQAVIREAREKYKVPIIVYYLRAPLYMRWLWDRSDDKIMQSLRDAGADVLEYDFPRGSKYRIEGDGHPTPLENANCARKLFDFVRERFPNVEATASQ